MNGHPLAPVALLLFIGAYALVMLEERLKLKKSQPMLLAAGLIWTLVAIIVDERPGQEPVEALIHSAVADFGELFLFLLTAMTYINVLSRRGLFDVLSEGLLARGFGPRRIFWATGAAAFCLSPIADNLTTALVLGAVMGAVAKGDKRLTTLGMINVVVASNAGGAFSPFGDITTLMVWQHGQVPFAHFLALLLPSLVNWLVPALLLTPFVADGQAKEHASKARLAAGAQTIVVMFLVTIVLAVVLHTFINLPPALGMTTGLALLQAHGWWEQRRRAAVDDTYKAIAHVEWDTLLFFYGVMLSVAGLGALGFLDAAMAALYEGPLGTTSANILVGVLSATIDNIPVVYAVLTMNPDMSLGEWLLVTLTAGVGGSLLSIGSAAGVALMGQSRGVYTFSAHLAWSWAIALGFVASIGVHLWINRDLFSRLPGGG